MNRLSGPSRKRMGPVTSSGTALMLAGMGLLFLRVAVTIVKVPLKFLLPVITTLTVLGSYAVSNSMVGPITLAVAAILGLIMKHYNYPVVAMVIGLLLGRMMEGNLLRTWQLSRGDLTIYIDRPISLGLVIALVLAVLVPFGMKRLKARASANPEI